MSSMIKIEDQARGLLATRAVEAGIQNVLFTDCRSVEDVRECIRLVRPETPEAGGVHGYVAGRIVLGGGGLEAWIKAMNDVVIAFMIEKKEAMENLEEILSIEGVDMVRLGGTDYSMSIGKPGQMGHFEVQKAQRDMIELAMRKGVAPLVQLRGGGFEDAKPFIEMGVRHFCVCTDLNSIAQQCKQQGEGMRRLLASV
jgi:4-hydroxy-2-oxoheptanedioate aldolase